MSTICPPRPPWPSLPSILTDWAAYLNLPRNRPLVISLRTYALALSLSAGPALVPLISSNKASHTRMARLRKIFGRELAPTGFAFAMAAAVGGGAVLDHFLILTAARSRSVRQSDQEDPSISSPWHKRWSEYLLKLTPKQSTFLANIISCAVAFQLLNLRRRSSTLERHSANRGGTHKNTSNSHTIDITLILFVRVLDAISQSLCRRLLPPSQDRSELVASHAHPGRGRQDRSQKDLKLLTGRIDAAVFWAASARIMWCFFYKPETLPKSYVKWISSLANVDHRLLEALRRLRDGSWTYGTHSSTHRPLLMAFAQDLGYPASWGDSSLLPPFGGAIADKQWKVLGVSGRESIGGMPCEIVHGGVSKMLGGEGSCLLNAVVRGSAGFLQAMLIYLPVHFLPVILRRSGPFTPPVIISTFLSCLRSSAFLASFISSIWYTVCLTRTVVLARLLPYVSHNFWDGPYGCILAGCLTCGGSIWIEESRRRGEMALYVLPRALRTVLNTVEIGVNRHVKKLLEGAVFTLSMATLLTAGTHQPLVLRGLSRWTLNFIIKEPKDGH